MIKIDFGPVVTADESSGEVIDLDMSIVYMSLDSIQLGGERVKGACIEIPLYALENISFERRCCMTLCSIGDGRQQTVYYTRQTRRLTS